MRRIIRITLGVAMVWGLLEAYQKLDRAADALFKSICDRNTYPEHPEGKQWKEMSFEYRKKYTLWFRDEVHRRFHRSSALGVLSWFAAFIGVPGVTIWTISGCVRRRPAAVPTAAKFSSETQQPQKEPSCDTAAQS